MTATFDVSVLCPRCDSEIMVAVTVSGGYEAPSRMSPGESPDVEYSAPKACTHDVEEGFEFTPGPFTIEEAKQIDVRIEEAAMASVVALYDDAPDGPEDRE